MADKYIPAQDILDHINATQPTDASKLFNALFEICTDLTRRVLELEARHGMITNSKVVNQVLESKEAQEAKEREAIAYPRSMKMLEEDDE